MRYLQIYLVRFMGCWMVLAGAAMPFSTRAQTSRPGKCLIISDIHLDMGASTPLQNLKGKDPGPGLLRLAVSQMKTRLPHPAFIVLAGDFIRHAKEDSGSKAKAIHFIAQLFRDSFPNVPLVPALGNNDTYGDDYADQSPAFLSVFAREFGIPGEQFKKAGYYTYVQHHLKLIVLNSALLSENTYKRSPDTAVLKQKAGSMFAWVERELLSAQKNKEDVWLLMHIPPGENAFAKLTGGDKLMWKTPYSQVFTNLVVKYAPTIRISIASHIHRNDFRVFCDTGGRPVAYLRLIPSFSPVYENNPSFEVAELDNSHHVARETTWYLDLAANAVTSWGMLSQNSVPGLNPVDAASLFNFNKKFEDVKNLKDDKTLSAVFGQYIKVYNVGGDITYRAAANLNLDNYADYLAAHILKAHGAEKK